ncbi:hypothetical protein COCON_G00126620 [Conger conger]|uniref:Uncharacterized protein n=1 Tax=Conger conger TaxID=82655 RepID=A0A9Q1HW73_CONCO|nr:hypothetical protein COCON_G00126620 [Conger conger]
MCIYVGLLVGKRNMSSENGNIGGPDYTTKATREGTIPNLERDVQGAEAVKIKRTGRSHCLLEALRTDRRRTVSEFSDRVPWERLHRHGDPAVEAKARPVRPTHLLGAGGSVRSGTGPAFVLLCRDVVS